MGLVFGTQLVGEDGAGGLPFKIGLDHGIVAVEEDVVGEDEPLFLGLALLNAGHVIGSCPFVEGFVPVGVAPAEVGR